MKATIKFEDGRTAEIKLTQEQVEHIKSKTDFNRCMNVISAGCNGFFSTDAVLRKNELHTFQRKEHAQFLADRFNLEMEMFRWASGMNEGWNTDFKLESYWVLFISRKAGVVPSLCSTTHTGVFGIAFKSKEIAEQAKEIFGDRILSLYGKQF